MIENKVMENFSGLMALHSQGTSLMENNMVKAFSRVKMELQKEAFGKMAKE